MVLQTQILIPDDKTLYASLHENIQKINYLKSALYIDKNIDFNEEVINKTVFEQNLKNILLLKLVINILLTVKILK